MDTHLNGARLRKILVTLFLFFSDLVRNQTEKYLPSKERCCLESNVFCFRLREKQFRHHGECLEATIS